MYHVVHVVVVTARKYKWDSVRQPGRHHQTSQCKWWRDDGGPRQWARLSTSLISHQIIFSGPHRLPGCHLPPHSGASLVDINISCRTNINSVSPPLHSLRKSGVIWHNLYCGHFWLPTQQLYLGCLSTLTFHWSLVWTLSPDWSTSLAVLSVPECYNLLPQICLKIGQ